MYRIVETEFLAADIKRFVIEAPRIVPNVKPASS